jgi:hypothetical protein
MFRTDSGRPLKRPVISTLTAATAELKKWLEESCLSTFQDGDGQAWQLGLKVTQRPDPATTNGLLWAIRLGLTAQVSGRELVSTGVLCPDKDHRLLSLIGVDLVPMAMRPSIYQAANESEARQVLVVALPDLRKTLEKQSLVEVKRDLIGRWLDDQCRFGAHRDGF